MILPPLTVKIFQVFGCDNLDVLYESGEKGGVSVLRVDYSVSCLSAEYSNAVKWAIAMIIVYPVGVVLLMSITLWSYKELIKKETEKKFEELDGIRSLFVVYEVSPFMSLLIKVSTSTEYL